MEFLNVLLSGSSYIYFSQITCSKTEIKQEKLQKVCVFICEGCHNKGTTVNGLNSGDLLSHISGSQKSQVRVLGGLVPSEATRENLFLEPWCVGGRLWHPPIITLISA